MDFSIDREQGKIMQKNYKSAARNIVGNVGAKNVCNVLD